MTPTITDVYIQSSMINEYFMCCNRETEEIKMYRIEPSWLHSRLGEHVYWNAGPHITNHAEPFYAGICNNFQTELIDFKERARKFRDVFYAKEEPAQSETRVVDDEESEEEEDFRPRRPGPIFGPGSAAYEPGYVPGAAASSSAGAATVPEPSPASSSAGAAPVPQPPAAQEGRRLSQSEHDPPGT